MGLTFMSNDKHIQVRVVYLEDDGSRTERAWKPQTINAEHTLQQAVRKWSADAAEAAARRVCARMLTYADVC